MRWHAKESTRDWAGLLVYDSAYGEWEHWDTLCISMFSVFVVCESLPFVSTSKMNLYFRMKCVFSMDILVIAITLQGYWHTHTHTRIMGINNRYSRKGERDRLHYYVINRQCAISAASYCDRTNGVRCHSSYTITAATKTNWKEERKKKKTIRMCSTVHGVHRNGHTKRTSTITYFTRNRNSKPQFVVLWMLIRKNAPENNNALLVPYYTTSHVCWLLSYCRLCACVCDVWTSSSLVYDSGIISMFAHQLQCLLSTT